MGFNKAANPDAVATLKADIEKINALPTVPEFLLHTGDISQKVRFYEDVVKDKIVTINFFYARCEGIWPIVTDNLVKVQKLLADRVGRDIFMVSLTLKPLEDTPEVLKEYAEMHRIKPGWTLLTGKPDDIDQLRRSLGFTNLEPQLDQDKSQHIGNIRYGNEPMLQWAAMPGMAQAAESGGTFLCSVQTESMTAATKKDASNSKE